MSASPQNDNNTQKTTNKLFTSIYAGHTSVISHTHSAQFLYQLKCHLKGSNHFVQICPFAWQFSFQFVFVCIFRKVVWIFLWMARMAHCVWVNQMPDVEKIIHVFWSKSTDRDRYKIVKENTFDKVSSWQIFTLASYGFIFDCWNFRLYFFETWIIAFRFSVVSQ